MSSKISRSYLWNQFNATIKKQTSPIEVVSNCIETGIDKTICLQCSSNMAWSDEGYLTCLNTSCGAMCMDILDSSPEWRYYGCDDNSSVDPTRCGMPINPLLPESSFGCKIMNCGSSSYEIRKLRRYAEWQSMPYKEKARYDDFQLITNMAKNSNISQIIIDTALVYHTKITSQDKSFRGTNRNGILAASIYLSFKKHGCARDETEIANIFNLDISTTTTGCKTALTILNTLEAHLPENERTFWNKTTSQDFVDRYCSKLNMSEDIRKYCMFISKVVEKQHLMPANTPTAICVGIIYFVSQICALNKTKKEINQISYISEVTINKCYKILEQHKQILVPKQILDKYAGGRK
jgi:transcription initiation factor TFIIB